MRNFLIVFVLLLCGSGRVVHAVGADTARVVNIITPILLDHSVNPLCDIELKGVDKSLESIAVSFPRGGDNVESVALYYTGTTSMFASRSTSQALWSHFNIYGGGQAIYKAPSYAVKVAEVKVSKDDVVVLECHQQLFQGATNYFYVSVCMKNSTTLSDILDFRVEAVKTDGGVITIFDMLGKAARRMGVSVRNAGDDGVHSYRIPALVTAQNGDLLAAYDIRNNTSFDLQEDVQVGLSRSKDGGRSWRSMQTIMDMRGYGGLPDSQNGVGDPALLVDSNSGTIWAIALWTHAMGGGRAWNGCQVGMTPESQSAQVMLAKSQNRGSSWSEPINITDQVKLPEWRITLQGPGNGITMKDGTLVFAFQYVDSTMQPSATIIYSKDSGKTWACGTPIISNTTEAQVVELEDGVLMINARDNRGGSRSIYTTTDLGATWSEHPSSRSALIEPVCMASLLKVNYRGEEILLFSNPSSTSARKDMTIKASKDGGNTWSKGILIDEETSWGYSCMSEVEEGVIGIFYESSRAQLIFQQIKLEDILF